MNRLSLKTGMGIAAVLLLPPLPGHAFNSGSTGADGAFNPTVNTELQLPPDGVFNFTSVNIPNGVTITFKRNSANTPAVILAQGNIIIDGIVDANGKSPAPTGTGALDGGDPADDGLPGAGGPGGFDGGRGGLLGSTDPSGGSGLGPGGGGGGTSAVKNGGYAGHATPGYTSSGNGTAGGTYGSPLLRPLIGGSGGGGAYAYWDVYGARIPGEGGGGGGGAILLAASGSIRLSGSVTAYGGWVGSTGAVKYTGGPGSGGAIRLVATEVSGRGTLFATNAVGNTDGLGRIRVEAEVFGDTFVTYPPFSSSLPTDLFVPGLPALAITSVAGIPVPANPVGRGDVALAAATPNPVTVELQTNGVPPGTVIQVTLIPEFGAKSTVDSLPTAGSLDGASTRVSLNIPDGRSVLTATTTFTVVAALGERLSPFAQGEPVERVRLSTEPGQPSRMVLFTASGREVEVPAATLAAGW